jgi:cell volume regulation protein A
VLRRIALPASGLYPIAVLSLIVSAYGLAVLLHGSGFLATYVAAVVLGNSGLPHRPTTRSFTEGLAWLAQIGLFVLLGLLADPSRLGREVGPALVVGGVLLLVARPLSVAVSNLPFALRRKGLNIREQVFVSWAGLRGAVPIVMTTVPRDPLLFDLTFVLVVVFTLVQAPTLPWFARRTEVVDEGGATELDIESSPLSTLDVDVLEIDVSPGSLLHGVELFELRLPEGAAVTLLVRDGHAMVPTSTTPLRAGDRLLVVVTARARELTERRLRAVSRSGRLAGWRGDQGAPR